MVYIYYLNVVLSETELVRERKQLSARWHYCTAIATQFKGNPSSVKGYINQRSLTSKFIIDSNFRLMVSVVRL